MLTPKIVAEYRYLYYEIYKGLMEKHHSDTRELRKEFQNNAYGWSWRKFEFYKSIDFSQRLVFDHAKEYTKNGLPAPVMSEEFKAYDPNLGALRLKCPVRSTDPDEFN